MSEDENKGTAGEAAAAKARELQAAIKKLDFRDRVVFLGSAALVILFFLPWWRITYTTMLGTEGSESYSGLAGAGWAGFLAGCAGTIAGLANMNFIPLAGELKRLCGMTTVQLGLAAAALLMGPVYFLSADKGRMNLFGLSQQGHTLFFWLALLCALGAAGCAGWKLADERKAAGGGGPPPAQ